MALGKVDQELMQGVCNVSTTVQFHKIMSFHLWILVIVRLFKRTRLTKTCFPTQTLACLFSFNLIHLFIKAG